MLTIDALAGHTARLHAALDFLLERGAHVVSGEFTADDCALVLDGSDDDSGLLRRLGGTWSVLDKGHDEGARDWTWALMSADFGGVRVTLTTRDLGLIALAPPKGETFRVETFEGLRAAA